MGFFGAEGADALKPELEFRPVDPVEALDDFVCGPAIDIADEAKCDVVILHIDPSCSGKTTAQQ